MTPSALIRSQDVKDESVAHRGARKSREFGTDIRHGVVPRRYASARVRTDQSRRRSTCQRSERSLVREWNVLVRRAEGLNNAVMTGRVGHCTISLLYFCVHFANIT